MTTDPNLDAAAPGIVDRVKNILLKPQQEWDRIAGEPADVQKLYVGYVLPLAAIAAVCMAIGLMMFPWGFMRFSPVTAVVTAAIQLVSYVVGIYLIAVIANALAPNFGAAQDQGQAHKLMAYSFTAALLAGVFSLHPALAVLGLLGLYSFVLLFIGLPRLMKTPEDKRVGYFATLVVVGIVVFIVMGIVTGAVRSAMVGVAAPGITIGQSSNSGPGGARGEVALPGGGSIDLEALQKQAETYASGGAAPVDPQRLQDQLPQTLPGGFSRTSLSNSSAMGAAQAEAVYQSGAAELRVTVVHLGAMGAMTAMAAAANVQQSRQDADGYARTQTIDGRVYTEEVDTRRGAAKYAVIGRGVGITAEGTGGVTLDQARAAVETIGVQRLERAFGG